MSLLFRVEDPLLILQVLTRSGLVVQHRLVLAVISCHLLSRACHVSDGHAARTDLQRRLPDMRLRLVRPRGRTCTSEGSTVRSRGRGALLLLVHEKHLWLPVLQGLIVSNQVGRASTASSAQRIASFAVAS